METSTLLSHGAARVPYLALKHVADSNQPVFFSISDKKVIDIEAAAELTNNNCWATPQGWILVRDASSATTYLLDPHSPPSSDARRRISLPHLPEHNLSTYCTCLLSDDPASPSQETNSRSSIVLLVETDAPVIWYCRTDGEEWATHEYDIGTREDLDGRTEKEIICQIAACQGRFYFEGYAPNRVGVLEFCPAPSFRSIQIRNAVSVIKGCYYKQFMVESKQELYVVYLKCGPDLDNFVYGCSVHKMDFIKDELHQVDDIGDQVFLLSSWYFGASRSADECGLQLNCLYVIYPWNKQLMIFNLREPTAAKVHDFDEAPACDQALWMMPTHP